jgi:hypothetical protein
MSLRIDIYCDIDEEDIGKELPLETNNGVMAEVRGSDGKIYKGTFLIKDLICVGSQDYAEEL